MDFTTMSDRQLAEFFKKPEANVCGRFYGDQLNRNIDVAGKRIPWLNYFFQISLPAFLVSMKANAQGKVTLKGDTVCTSVTLGTPSITVPDKPVPLLITITGKVTDENRDPVPSAIVAIKGTSQATATDVNGNFALRIAKDKSCVLTISSVGFSTKEILVAGDSMLIALEPVSLCTVTMGLVYKVSVKKKVEKIPAIRRVVDTAFKRFSVYPNPAQTNSSIKINLKKAEPGEYSVSIIDLSGKLVQNEEVLIENKKQVIELRLKSLAKGTYFVHLLNRKTAASYSEKIIVD